MPDDDLKGVLERPPRGLKAQHITRLPALGVWVRVDLTLEQDSDGVNSYWRLLDVLAVYSRPDILPFHVWFPVDKGELSDWLEEMAMETADFEKLAKAAEDEAFDRIADRREEECCP